MRSGRARGLRGPVTLLLSGLVVIAPASVRSESAAARLAYLSLGASDTTSLAILRAAFLERLRDLGHVEGRTLALETRFADGTRERLPALAAELVRLHPDVLVGEGFEATQALKRATISTPIVMFACDALAGGLVASLARPGGNVSGVTCITAELAAKRLDLLKELAPAVTRVGVLGNVADPAMTREVQETKAAGSRLGLTLQAYDTRTAGDLDRAFADMKRERVGAALVLGFTFPVVHGNRIVELAATHRLPVMYSFREFVDLGGLISYGPNAVEMFRQLAAYVDKVLRGGKIGDLPVQQPTTFELALNLRTANALGLTVPPSLALRVDRLIE